MSTSRSRTRDDASRSGTTKRHRMSSGGTTPAVLEAYREHPPMTAHVNGCDYCLGWLMLYMTSVVMTRGGTK